MTTLAGPPLATAAGIGALTMGAFLESVCDTHHDREALVFDDPLRGGATTRLTYADLASCARRVARSLLAGGTGKGSRVGILMGNRPEAVATFFGAALAGAVVVPLSTFATRPELEWMIADSDLSVLVTQTRLLGRPFAEELAPLSGDPRFPYLRTIVAAGGPDLPPGVERWEAFCARGDSLAPAVARAAVGRVSPSDHGLIIYSSGTTDRPKGILHNHRSPTLQFWLQARIFGRSERTRMWTALPMFWTAGINTAMGSTLAAGGCWVMQETFDPGPALALMARERVTEPYTLPHQTAALEEHPDWLATDLSALRCVFGKSAFARHPTVHGDTAWNMPVGYGLSETCAFFASHHSDTPRELLRQSIGRLLPGNRLRVVDPDTGTVLPAGAEGEFAIAGPTLMEHYVGRTRDECFDEDGYFHTGDIGSFDEDGFVHYTGRRTEMIKTAGANVSPAEIEVALRAFPPVKLARAIGMPDPRYDQVVVLCVTVKDGMRTTENEIRDFLRGRIASYKVPRRVLFFDEGEIPMTTSETKVRDQALSALVAARLATTHDPGQETR